MQCSAVLRRAVQCSAVLRRAVQRSAAQGSAAQGSDAQGSDAQGSDAQRARQFERTLIFIQDGYINSFIEWGSSGVASASAHHVILSCVVIVCSCVKLTLQAITWNCSAVNVGAVCTVYLKHHPSSYS